MIGFSVEDGHGSVDLLCEEHAYHLVGECHSAEADLFVSTLVNAFRKAVRAADDEDEPLRTCRHLLLHPGGEVRAAAFAAVFVEQNDVVSRLEASQDEFSFALLLLALAESLRVLEVGDDFNGKGNIVPDALHVLIRDGFEAFVCSLAYHDEHSFHGSASSSSGGATYS